MTDLRKAAEMALEALDFDASTQPEPMWEKERKALRQALAQPEQKKEWVGLMDKDFPEHFIYEFDRGARWAEAKLKEKNT